MKVDLQSCIDTFNGLHLYAQKSTKEGFYRVYEFQPDYDDYKGGFARRKCSLVGRIFNLTGQGTLEWCPMFLARHPEFSHIKCERHLDKNFYLTVNVNDEITMAQSILEAIHTIKPVKRLKQSFTVHENHADLGHLPIDKYVNSYRPLTEDFNFNDGRISGARRVAKSIRAS